MEDLIRVVVFVLVAIGFVTSSVRKKKKLMQKVPNTSELNYEAQEQDFINEDLPEPPSILEDTCKQRTNIDKKINDVEIEEEDIYVDNESSFDLRKAVVYSEILKRKEF